MGARPVRAGWSGLGAVVQDLRQTHDEELVELRSLRERYMRQLEYYRDIPGGECPPARGHDPALDAAWVACREAYAAWQAAYERWEALRTGAR